MGKQQRTQGQGNQNNQRNQQPPAQQQAKPTQQPQPAIPINVQEFHIGCAEFAIDENDLYPSISEFLETVDILLYDEFAGELKNKNKDDYWAAEGIDQFCSELGIGVCELSIYDLGSDWLVMAQAHCVTDGRTMCAAVTHDKKDTHSLEKAVRRAGRNARSYMIPLVLLRQKLEDAKQAKAKSVKEENLIKEASTKAGATMRANRQNFDSLTEVPTLLSKAEEIRGRFQKDWKTYDWEWLTESIEDPDSYLLRQFKDGEEEVDAEEEITEEVEENVTEEESEEENSGDDETNWEELTEDIEETE